jgi:hypothetical protein
LYPVIVQSLADDKFAFASLHVSGKGGIVNSELQTTDMTLTQARTIPGDDTYSLGGYTLDRSEVLRPVRDALAKFGPNPKLPTKDEVSSLVIAETKEGRALDAFLAVCEQTWMTNDDMLENIKRLKMPLSLDSNCGAVMAAMSQPKKEQMDDVEKLLAKIDRSKLKHSEAIDVLLANDFAGVGSPQRGQELMIKALTKNPLLVGAYIDLMQIMIMQFQMPAWECAEIARELNPNYSRIKEIDQREQQIQTLFPHYF